MHRTLGSDPKANAVGESTVGFANVWKVSLSIDNIQMHIYMFVCLFVCLWAYGGLSIYLFICPFADPSTIEFYAHMCVYI